ncbi:MAG TPA: hypothetical protein ENK23_00125 [Sorangium sp.]|nr:hypothetical protein [Sorangium sp.]
MMLHSPFNRPLTTRLLLAAAAATGLTLAAPDAVAGDILAPGTRPMWVAGAIGPTLGISNLTVNQFKLEQEFGYHFSGDSSGPAIGASIGESFGSGFTVLTPGAKFWWDIQIIDDMAIYVSPSAKLGYGGFFGGGTSVSAFNWELAAEGKVVLGDRGMLFFRPVGVDFFADDNGLAVRYDIMLGGGVTL